MSWSIGSPRRLVALMMLVLFLSAVGLPAAPSAHAAAGQRYLDPIFTGVTVQRDLVYGRAPGANGVDEILKLDLYQPAGDTAAARPVVVFAHGGAFTQGDKSTSTWVAVVDQLARRGFVAASINFRLTGESADATDDMQAAVRWFRSRASTLRIDPSRIAVMGSSSGAIQALETNFGADDPGNSGNPGYPSDVAGAIAISWGQHTGIDPGEPPIAIFESFDDTTYAFPLTEATCAQTIARGNVCEMYRYPDGGHGRFLLTGHFTTVLEQTGEFLCRQVLGPTRCPAPPPPPAPGAVTLP